MRALRERALQPLLDQPRRELVLVPAAQLVAWPQSAVHIGGRGRGHLLGWRRWRERCTEKTRERPSFKPQGLLPPPPASQLSPGNGADLVGPSVKPGHIQGAFQVTEAGLTQVLDDPGAEGGHAGRQGQPRVLQGGCDTQTSSATTQAGVTVILNAGVAFREHNA